MLMMGLDDGHVIVDVRRQDEYISGHIPGAILIPNESIGTEPPTELPDKDQVILVYCRSGRRSKEAAGKLAEMGYTYIYEFGGIITWTGETVMGEEPETYDGQGTKNALQLWIGDAQVPVTWEENASVKALQGLLPLTIEMSMYGGFEQVGAIGQSIIRDDKRITTVPGDIVLYSGDQIVLFYGSNTWSYTMLGHMGLSESELRALLANGGVTVVIK